MAEDPLLRSKAPRLTAVVATVQLVPPWGPARQPNAVATKSASAQGQPVLPRRAKALRAGELAAAGKPCGSSQSSEAKELAAPAPAVCRSKCTTSATEREGEV